MNKLGIFNQAAAPLNLDAFKPKTEAETGPAPEEIDQLTAGNEVPQSRAPTGRRSVNHQPAANGRPTVDQAFTVDLPDRPKRHGQRQNDAEDGRRLLRTGAVPGLEGGRDLRAGHPSPAGEANAGWLNRTGIVGCGEIRIMPKPAPVSTSRGGWRCCGGARRRRQRRQHPRAPSRHRERRRVAVGRAGPRR